MSAQLGDEEYFPMAGAENEEWLDSGGVVVQASEMEGNKSCCLMV